MSVMDTESERDLTATLVLDIVSDNVTESDRVFVIVPAANST